MKAELFLRCENAVGEGPLWDDEAQRWCWVDILGREIHSTDANGDDQRVHRMDKHVGAIARRAGGGLVAAVQDGFQLLHPNWEPERHIPVNPDAARRFNDAKVDPSGRLVAGLMAYDMSPGDGCLYRLDHTLAWNVLLEDCTVPNGMAWDESGETLYFIDSARQTIDAFDYGRHLTSPRTVVTIPPQDGAPDGMTIDADGCLWVALWGGGQVRRYDGTGKLMQRIDLPVPHVTSCAFGGPRHDQLAITTAQEGLDDQALREHPLSGSVFIATPGTRGRPAHQFLG